MFFNTDAMMFIPYMPTIINLGVQTMSLKTMKNFQNFSFEMSPLVGPVQSLDLCLNTIT